MQSRDLLESFMNYCMDNPSLRFWQALRNWAGVRFILASNATDYSQMRECAEDTFYWETRNGQKRSTSTGD